MHDVVPISTKNTGSSIKSQKSAKTSRSRARNRPSIVPSSKSNCATNSRVRGMLVASTAQNVQTVSSNTSQIEMPVAPK